MWTTFSPTPDTTFSWGFALGRRAVPGTVVSLIGDLGAGKTVFAQGIAAGLGVPDRVQSPTFILAQQHEGGRLPLWHLDVYRLGRAEELDALGLEDMLDAGGVVLIEWGDRVARCLPEDRLDITLGEEGAGRRVTVEAKGPRHAPLEAIDA